MRERETDLGVLVKALTSGQISDSLFGEPGGAHHLDDVEAGPADVVAEHLEVRQLRHRVRLDRQVVLPQFLK